MEQGLEFSNEGKEKRKSWKAIDGRVERLEAKGLSERGGPRSDHRRELGGKSQLFLSLDTGFI